MSDLRARFVILLTISFVVLTVSQTQSATALVAGLAALAITTVILAQRTGALVLRVQLGTRAREHRQLVTATPSPAHPNTAGRTRSRAPGQSALAA
jgi:hypothetical protein